MTEKIIVACSANIGNNGGNPSTWVKVDTQSDPRYTNKEIRSIRLIDIRKTQATYGNISSIQIIKNMMGDIDQYWRTSPSFQLSSDKNQPVDNYFSVDIIKRWDDNYEQQINVIASNSIKFKEPIKFKDLGLELRVAQSPSAGNNYAQQSVINSRLIYDSYQLLLEVEIFDH